MPFINVKIAAPIVEAEQIAQIQAGVTGMMAEILGKKRELTAVLVEQVVTGCWSIGGQQSAVSAHLDVKITAGTNTPEEKARFITEAHQLLKRIMGPQLPTATYIVLDELPGDAWGYSGLTQIQRASTGNANP